MAPTDTLPVVCYDAEPGERSPDLLHWSTTSMNGRRPRRTGEDRDRQAAKCGFLFCFTAASPNGVLANCPKCPAQVIQLRKMVAADADGR